MRNYKFRGKRKDNNQWVYGSLVSNFQAEICDESSVSGFRDEVHEETVGQYIGIEDVNDKYIFEGDKFEVDDQDEYYAVEYNSEEARFQVNMYGYKQLHNEGGGEEYEQEISCVDEDCFEMSCLCSLEIIGNIHEPA